MGMFDYINYKDQEYQSKDTPDQALSYYKIDGHEYLWLQHYDSEWITDEGHIFGAYEKQSNHHWVRCDDFTGNIVFYRNVDKTYKKWNQYNAFFIKGKLDYIYKWEGEDYE